MATRPWVTPKQVKDYTDSPEVKKREESKLEADITRAELYVINYTKNDFSNGEKYPEAPESVTLAVTLLAEMYAIGAIDAADKGNFKSESFDDYSYTIADTAKKQENLDLAPLLDPYIVTGPRNTVELRMRML